VNPVSHDRRFHSPPIGYGRFFARAVAITRVPRKSFFVSLAFAWTAFGSAAPVAAEAPAIAQGAPISVFRLPTFNPDGYRTSLLRGKEARYVNQNQIDLSDMNLTLYFGDGTDRVDSVLLAPQASVSFKDNKLRVSGEQSVHVTRQDFDAIGERWTYDHVEKSDRILIEKNVRVVFRAQLNDILK
jgi:hypothetical protein